METVLQSKTVRELARTAAEHWRKQALDAEGRTPDVRDAAHTKYLRANRIFRVASIADVSELRLNDQDLEACLG